MSGDQCAVEVLETAAATVESQVANELDNLAEEQIERQAELEMAQQEEIVAMAGELDAVLETNEKNIGVQIEEQKKKVLSTILSSSSSSSSSFSH